MRPAQHPRSATGSGTRSELGSRPPAITDDGVCVARTVSIARARLHAPAALAARLVLDHLRSMSMFSAPNPDAHVAAQPARGRVLLLDLVRLLAALQMVQGHTIDALLAPEFRAGMGYSLWLSSRGLTSVAFLFVAGLTFGVTALRDGGWAGGPNSARRLRRAGLLIALGYALRLPIGLLAGPSPSEVERLLRAAYLVDILQCMGASLALAEGLACVLRSARATRVASGLLAAVLLGASPLLHGLPPHGPLGPLLAYLTPRGGSLFPLFPWAGHLFLGVAASAMVSLPRGRVLRLLLASCAVLAVAALVRGAGVALTADHLSRLSWVLGWTALISLFEQRAAALPSWLLRLSRETLFIYVFHVLVVYADGVGVAARLGQELAPLPAVGAAAAMIVLSFGGALGRLRLQQALRRRLKSGRPALAGTTAPG